MDTAGVAIEYGDAGGALEALAPLWRCSRLSDCRLRGWCALRVEALGSRLNSMPPAA